MHYCVSHTDLSVYSFFFFAAKAEKKGTRKDFSLTGYKHALFFFCFLFLHNYVNSAFSKRECTFVSKKRGRGSSKDQDGVRNIHVLYNLK